MTAEIDMSNGKANVAYVGEVPWHGLGQSLTPGAPLEIWAEQAGQNWEAKRAALRYTAGKDTVSIPNRKALYRSDTHAFLGMVADGYHIVQPKEVLEFYRDLISDFGFEMETAGCLFGGKRVWALANCKKTVALKGDDVNKLYLLLATSFDGSMSTQARLTGVRVVCNNTLELATTDGAKVGNNVVRVYHTAKFDADAVKKQLDVDARWQNFCDTASKMQERQVSKAEVIDFLTNLYKINPNSSELIKNRFLARMEHSLFNAPGAQKVGSAGTLWGVLNAVTFDVDHKATRVPDYRMSNGMMGTGSLLKQEAWKMAELALAA